MAERLWPQALLQGHRVLCVAAALCLAVALGANLPWRLDDYDQAKQAFTSFQMLNEGRWFYQSTPHDRVATKPPLVGWISAALFSTTRSWELAWRLPSLLAAIGIGFLLFRLSRDAYAPPPAVLALSAFGLNLLTPRLTTLVRTDMPLALVIFIIGALIWQKIRHAEAWQFRDRLLIFALLTAGMLIKGPVVWAFLLPGIAGYYFWRRKAEPAAFPGWWPWIASLTIFLLWVAGGVRFVAGFYDEVIVREFLGRFGGGVHRPQPLLFYFPHLLHKFAPWSVLMIGLGLMELRLGKWKWRSINISPETRWLICWSLGGLIMMSLLPSKRVDRIYPVIPPLCLLLAAQIRHRLTAAQPAQMYRWAAITLVAAVLLTGSYVIFKVGSAFRNHRDALVKFGSNVRKLANANHWRYAVISSPDEGLLLYLQKLRFVSPDRAMGEWSAGQMDALVVSATDASELLNKLGDNAQVHTRSVPQKDSDTREYVLVTKSKPKF